MMYGEIFAAVFAFFVAVLFAAALVGIPRKKLDRDRRRNEAVVNSQLVGWSGAEDVFHSAEEASPGAVKRLVRRDGEGGGRPSVSHAKTAVALVVSAMPDVRGGDLVRRLASEAALVAVFGGIGVGGASLALPSVGGGVSTPDLVPVGVVIEIAGTVASLVLALTLTLGGVIYQLWWLVALVLAAGAVILYRLDEAGREGAYSSLRKAFATVGVLALPLLLAYIVAALEGGLLDAVSATPGVGLLALALAGIGIGGVAHYGVRAVDDVQRRVHDRLRRLSVGAVARASVKPVAFAGIVGVVFISLALIGVGTAISAVGAVAVGVLYRVAYRVVQSAKYRAIQRRDRDPQPVKSVVVEAGTIRGPTDETLYVASVQGERMLNDDLDALAVDVANYAGELLEEGTKRPTMSRHRYDAAREGTVSRDRARRELRQTIRADVLDWIESRKDKERVDDYLQAEYPPEYASEVMTSLVYDERRMEVVGGDYRRLE